MASLIGIVCSVIVALIHFHKLLYMFMIYDKNCFRFFLFSSWVCIYIVAFICVDDCFKIMKSNYKDWQNILHLLLLPAICC